MDRNTVTGLILIGVIMLAFFIFNMKQAEKQQEQLEKTAQSQDSTAITKPPPEEYLSPMEEEEAPEEERVVEQETTDSTQKAQSLKQKFGPFYKLASGDEELDTLENKDVRVVFSNKGGSIYSVELKDYMTWDSLPLILFTDVDNKSDLQFAIPNNRNLSSLDLYFSKAQFSPSEGKIVYRAAINDKQYLERAYTLNKDNKYVVDYDIKLVGLEKVIPPSSNYLNLHWKRKIRKLEQVKKNENRYTELHYRYTNGDLDNLSKTSEDSESLTTSVSWVSFKQQFFNTTIISKNGFDNGTVTSKPTGEEVEDYLKTMSTSLRMPYNHEIDQAYHLQYYFGPNHYQTLKSLKIDLEDIVMVTGFMSWVSVITRWIIIPLFNWLNNFISNYGVIILILTVLIKMVLFPLTYRSYKSTAMMKVLKPELDELKEKYKDDQQKFATEQWKLFQSAGVSPLGGCLPMLLQMPILIAMYYFFPTSIELRQQSFLWVHDLSTYDSVLHLPFVIPVYGDHVSAFTLLMAVSSILYAATNTQMTQGPSSMKYMPYIFPIMLLGIFNSFPAALTYYYFLANMISFLQQYITKKFIINEEALHKKVQENKKRPSKKSGLQRRLEKMAKQQREMQKQRGKKK